jgi:hypothetical protein
MVTIDVGVDIEEGLPLVSGDALEEDPRHALFVELPTHNHVALCSPD